MDRQDIIRWLQEEDPQRLENLWRAADEQRRRFVGPQVYLRGLIEFSNICRRHCGYCGLRADNTAITRYRMSEQEILDCADKAVALGYGTVVLQSGEDPAVTCQWLCDIIRAIKARTPLAVTLSVGERETPELAAWREAGADRYLLRFETSDPVLYDRIHPPVGARRSDRVAMLGTLRKLGYEIGSGVMVGITGQTYGSLANDIELFARLDLDMIGVGPWIAHPDTPMGKGAPQAPASIYQVPATELMTYKVLALARLVCPMANIPSTTALATINTAQGRELGLQRGANIVMPNLTPVKYRSLYAIYPGKACIHETADACQQCLSRRIESIGRTIGQGRGDSPRYGRDMSMRQEDVS
ncbi:MAG: [FeFe] hydrogenase H-cluster radical SAM maturase HydE [Phycisphaerae bacterium]